MEADQGKNPQARAFQTQNLKVYRGASGLIVVRRHDPIWNGAVIGLGIGIGAGTLIEPAGRTEYQKFSGSGAISLGTISMVTRFLIDIFNREKTTVYVQKPGRQ